MAKFQSIKKDNWPLLLDEYTIAMALVNIMYETTLIKYELQIKILLIICICCVNLFIS